MTCPVSGKTIPGKIQEEKGLINMEKVHLFDTIAEPIHLREMAKEPIFLLGGQYAILIQFIHPGLAQGSVEHSDFAGRIMNRLKVTARFLSACVYGTVEERKAIMGLIHRKHATVVGEGYFADDPELHKWTAATLFMSLIKVQEAIFGKGSISIERQEELLQETACYGTNLRMPSDMWPKTLAEFYKYWDHGIATLPVTPWAKTLYKQLMYPINLPIILHMGMPLSRLLTLHWLPERLRKEYGADETAMRRHLYGLSIAYIRTVYRLTPKKIRTLPHGYYKRDMQRSAKRIQETGTWIRVK